MRTIQKEIPRQFMTIVNVRVNLSPARREKTMANSILDTRTINIPKKMAF